MGKLIGLLVLVAVTVWVAVLTLPDGRLHVVFCDVGQGDAILISHKTNQILIDGGPNNQVLDCLANHMPFYDHQIEAVVMTHPDADHLTGLVDVFSRYSVLSFIRSDVDKDTKIYRSLTSLTANVPTTNVSTGDIVRVGDKLSLSIVWPTADWKDLAANTHSVVAILSWGHVDFLLTGDSDSKVDLAQLDSGLIMEVEVLKVPHHGSKTAMSQQWLEAVSPEVGVVMAGKNNRYGHPRPETVQQLENIGSKILRTDINGEIEVVTDGQKWWYNTAN